ncbi:SDR family oxidoreductase [soil metagenome]
MTGGGRPAEAQTSGAGPARAGLLLVTGATGYVGGRLVRVLNERGERVRCMARRPDELKARVPAGTEVVAGDVLDAATLMSALAGVDTAFYLIHSMGSQGDFREEDRRAANNFVTAAEAAGVRRIIYLGGLGANTDLSPHLASRQEVGEQLRGSRIAAIELRASVILGSGSLSFEMIRALVERLPVLVTPRWVNRRAQPIAIDDVLAYLVAAVDVPLAGSAIVEIGGPDQVTYRDLMSEYARQRGLRRFFVRVPVLTPGVSSLWLALVTPLYARVGRKLIDSIRYDTVVESNQAGMLFPDVEPVGVREAIARAATNEDREYAETRWSDALSSTGGSDASVAPAAAAFGTRVVDSRSVNVTVPPSQAFAPIRRIGGDRGWYYAGWLWRVRGGIDRLAGGPGLRRGRRSPHDLAPGDAVDFWRVEAIEADHLLRLRAEMRLPGRAWLQFEVRPSDAGSSITQTAIFDPVGVAGLLYWYSLFPLHSLIFGGMLKRIARAAQRHP